MLVPRGTVIRGRIGPDCLPDFGYGRDLEGLIMTGRLTFLRVPWLLSVLVVK